MNNTYYLNSIFRMEMPANAFSCTNREQIRIIDLFLTHDSMIISTLKNICCNTIELKKLEYQINKQLSLSLLNVIEELPMNKKMVASYVERLSEDNKKELLILLSKFANSK